MTIRVLVIDDSAVFRSILAAELARVPGIEVVGTALDPYVARDKILNLHPEVVTLDLEMPRMDGLTFLKKLMKYHPLPVIIVSSLTPQGSRRALEAILSGAADVVSKPGPGFPLSEMTSELVEKIRAASLVDRNRAQLTALSPPVEGLLPLTSPCAKHALIALGASTGGIQAIREILSVLPPESPGIVIVQHVPAPFGRSFAERLNESCPMEVAVAEDGNEVAPGLVLLAPGDRHMLVHRVKGRFFVRVREGPRVSNHRPSVNVLFKSVARSAGSLAVGGLLTGMGSDGAEGLAEIRDAGGRTIAQDKATCAVYGMPREAVRLGAAEFQLPLQEIPARLLQLAALAGASQLKD